MVLNVNLNCVLISKLALYYGIVMNSYKICHATPQSLLESGRNVKRSHFHYIYIFLNGTPLVTKHFSRTNKYIYIYIKETFYLYMCCYQNENDIDLTSVEKYV